MHCTTSPVNKKLAQLLRLLTASTVAFLATQRIPKAHAFPAYRSLGGLSERNLDLVLHQLKPVECLPAPPGPPSFTGPVLVDDEAHPWMPLRPGDLRGPCPGLNTLASHGYLPRNGVASPSQIITAVQDGFNMENVLARFTTYVAHIVDGNLVTDLMSIGDKTDQTGLAPPDPAIVGGLNNHGTFEGDASLTRADAFFGNNHDFNQPLFDQLKNFSDTFGNGFYNLTVASELRFQRINEGKALNPAFSIAGLRHITAYVEATFPITFFVDGRKANTSEEGQLDMETALSFFRDMRYPAGFFRRAEPGSSQDAAKLFLDHPTEPGRNVVSPSGNRTFSFVPDNSLGGFTEFCEFYTQFVNVTVRGLYPNTTGVLKANLDKNLQFLFEALPVPPENSCTRVFL